MNGLSILLFAAAKRAKIATDKSEDFNLFWIIFAILSVAIGAIAYFAYIRYRKIHANSHFALFLGLCRLHKLNSNSIDLLRNIAQHYQIEKPVKLFIEPGWLDQASRENIFQAESESLKSLRTMLFG